MSLFDQCNALVKFHVVGLCCSEFKVSAGAMVFELLLVAVHKPAGGMNYITCAVFHLIEWNLKNLFDVPKL